MTDFNIFRIHDFKATDVTVEPVSPFGQIVFAEWFGQGVHSVNIKKTDSPTIIAAIAKRRMTWTDGSDS